MRFRVSAFEFTVASRSDSHMHSIRAVVKLTGIAMPFDLGWNDEFGWHITPFASSTPAECDGASRRSAVGGASMPLRFGGLSPSCRIKSHGGNVFCGNLQPFQKHESSTPLHKFSSHKRSVSESKFHPFTARKVNVWEFHLESEGGEMFSFIISSM